MDLRKAFDLVCRRTLLNLLEQRGMAGKILTSLKTLYATDSQSPPVCPFLDKLEALLGKASDNINCLRVMDIILAILLVTNTMTACSSPMQACRSSLITNRFLCQEDKDLGI